MHLSINIYLSERAKKNNIFLESQRSVDSKAAAWVYNQ